MGHTVVLRHCEAIWRQREIVGHVLIGILPELAQNVERLFLLAQVGIGLSHVERAAAEVHGHIVVRNLLLALLQHGECLFVLAFLQQVLGKRAHQVAVGVAHAHHRLVEVDARLVPTTELELVHHVVVGLLRIEVLGTGSLRGERGDAVGKSLLHEVVAEVHIVLGAYGQRHVDRSCPVGVGNHLEHHQVALIEGTLAFE